MSACLFVMLTLTSSALAESLTAAAGRNACVPACERCTEVCVGNPSRIGSGYCAPSGYSRCPDQDCVRNDPSDPERCECSPACNSCTHECMDGNCVTRLPARKVCKSGYCANSNENCPDDCSPACDSCTEMCVTASDGSKSCKSTDKKYCPGKTACVSDTAQCGDQCTPKCDNCTQSCTDGQCKSNGNKRCWTGACVGPGSECPPDRSVPTPRPTVPVQDSKNGKVSW